MTGLEGRFPLRRLPDHGQARHRLPATLPVSTRAPGLPCPTTTRAPGLPCPTTNPGPALPCLSPPGPGTTLPVTNPCSWTTLPYTNPCSWTTLPKEEASRSRETLPAITPPASTPPPATMPVTWAAPGRWYPGPYIASLVPWRLYPRIPGRGFRVLGAPRGVRVPGPTSALSAVQDDDVLGSTTLLSLGEVVLRVEVAQSCHCSAVFSTRARRTRKSDSG